MGDTKFTVDIYPSPVVGMLGFCDATASRAAPSWLDDSAVLPRGRTEGSAGLFDLYGKR